MPNLDAILRILSPIRPKALNMAPRALPQSAELKGGLQQLQAALNQLKGRPGVRPADVEALWGHMDPMTMVQPQQLGALAQVPKRYAQRGATRESPDDLAMELATDLLYGPDYFERRLVALDDVLDDYAMRDESFAAKVAQLRQSIPGNIEEYETAAKSLLERSYGNQGTRTFNDYFADQYFDNAMGDAYETLADTASGPFGLRYFAKAQRQPESSAAEQAGGEYFETVLRGSPKWQRALERFAYYTPEQRHNELLNQNRAVRGAHFDNPAQLGHIRGTLGPGGKFMMLDELQSDPAEVLGTKYPGLQNIYGQLGGMLMDRAAAADIPTIMVPGAERIMSVRDPSAGARGFMENLYDKELRRVLYDPMRALGASVNEHKGYNVLGLPEGLREDIRSGRVLLPYAEGGPV